MTMSTNDKCNYCSCLCEERSNEAIQEAGIKATGLLRFSRKAC